MNAFTIKELASLSGIKAHTIRIWEQRYSFLKPRRTDTNIRYYSTDELKAVLNIALLNKYGYKISHIDKMSGEEMRQRVMTLVHVEAQQERRVNELLQYMVELDMHAFEGVLNEAIHTHGIDTAIRQLVFPFLEKIGILWLANQINPAQEHLVSNVIRQKLIAGIESLIPPKSSPAKAVLFLPEGEYHELGLLYAYYMFRRKGVQVLYLGASVPVNDMDFLLDIQKPDFVYTHLTGVTGNFNLDKFLQQAVLRLHQTPLVISGQMARDCDPHEYSNLVVINSMDELQQFISTRC
ncbi:MAG: MerR family transcriptional regulator [Candidatus Pseudobacter hemicellulosilyticus]|uniref:MerR family transcriptional regulator n=1 Tax=Candidatus Pseudobacter hemicellulosilyticus TaxID=3121375 RepID=A0AAJ5WSI1_9BACT|nr:MAG: MerR family transcriptional regulator [Pseudobacter sp.]